MNLILYINKIRKWFFALFDRDKEKISLNPNRDWLIILSSFAILLTLVSWFGISLFLLINNESFFEGKGEISRSPEKTIDKDGLARVLSIYEEKAREFEERKTSRLLTADPSI